MLTELRKDLNELSDPKKAEQAARFFKTNKGEYGEGDKFLGIKVPEQRKIAKQYQDLKLTDLQKLLNSKIHEHRSTALFILVLQYQKADQTSQEKITKFYIKNAKLINNWDLVDSSAPYILGEYILNHDREIIYKLVKSNNLWERRIAMLACYALIKQNQFKDALKIAEILLNDRHDLIHKAVGWMLREIGKRDQKVEESFLNKHAPRMPRTMLRYTIEKFPENKRKKYLNTKQT